MTAMFRTTQIDTICDAGVDKVPSGPLDYHSVLVDTDSSYVFKFIILIRVKDQVHIAIEMRRITFARKENNAEKNETFRFEKKANKEKSLSHFSVPAQTIKKS